MNENRSYGAAVVILFSLYIFILGDLEHMIRERSKVSFLSDKYMESPQFRNQKVSVKDYEEIRKEGKDNWIGVLLASVAQEGFQGKKTLEMPAKLKQYKPEEYQKISAAYKAIWKDVKFFPVAAEKTYFENTWLTERIYGGKRFHEGTDIFGETDRFGYYPVISMTDGTVEQKGWLSLGGRRIGIRSPHGGYFYYAHLSSYEKDFQTGESVKAGDILGYMGNTGYGSEGTSGKFPVHLHLGIYIEGPFQKELSVNPYWLLKIFEKKIRNYTY